MPLSTLSSDRDIPNVPWGRVWLFCAAAATIILCGYECLLRASGYEAGLKMDNAALWARERRSVRSGNPEQFVLLGDSRMQQDVDPDIFARALGNGASAAQLAIAGSKELPLLEHFANDKNFIGVVVYSFKPQHMTRDFLDGNSVAERERASDYIACYESETPAKRMDAMIYFNFGRRFFFPGTLETGLEFLNKNHRVGGGREPGRYGKSGIKVGMNRWVAADYDSEWGRRRRSRKLSRTYSAEDVITAAEVESYIITIGKFIDRIQKRGGRVVIVRLPSSGYMLEREKQLFPREKTWDVIARETTAVTIHFEDYPGLSKFTCGDSSHLDFRDVPEFSKELGKIIKNKLANSIL